jgi:hypothetical protein
MLNTRIATAGAILIAMAGAAAAQSDTSQAPSQAPGKPISLLQILLKPSTPQTSGDAEAPGTTETTAHKIVHRHRHRPRYASRKSHPAHDDEAAATGSAAPGDASVAPPTLDANDVAAAAPASIPFDAPATASLAGTSATASVPSEPSALVVDGQTVQIASQDEINALDLAADSFPTNTPSQPGAVQPNSATDTLAAADNMLAADSEPADSKSVDTPVVAFAERADGDNSRDIWYEDLLATLGCLLAAASAAWFLIGRAPPRRDGGSEPMLVCETEPMRR